MLGWIKVISVGVREDSIIEDQEKSVAYIKKCRVEAFEDHPDGTLIMLYSGEAILVDCSLEKLEKELIRK